MKHAQFLVTRFRNQSGAISWRVDGRLYGARIRRNFKSREEANAERAALETRAERDDSGLHSITTRLTVEQAREAEAVYRRLEGQTRSLSFCVDFALANHRDPICDISLADAASSYLTLRETDHLQGALSHRQFTSFRCELRALVAHFSQKTVSDLSPARLVEYFQRGQASKKTYNNRRGLIGAFLKHCLTRDWIAANPIGKVPHFRSVGHQRGSAPSLSAEKCCEIMDWAETHHDGALVPFIALCLFAGIRPDLYHGEISKLKPRHVRLDTGVILIEPEVSKVRMKRAVTIQPNLAAWLRVYPLDQYPIMPRGFRRLRLRFRKQFNLSHDILRHTFVSMFVAKFRSMGEAALQAGNSESIIRKHYLELKTEAEAQRFFGIHPSGQSGSAKAHPFEKVA